MAAVGCGQPAAPVVPLHAGHASVAPAEQLTGIGRIDDLLIGAEGLLSRLPHVVAVDVAVTATRPTHRIIHVLDWHLMDRSAFESDLQAAADDPIDADTMERLYAEHLDEVEAVQAELRAVLEPLANKHGATAAFQEGLTDRDVPAYQVKLAVLRETETRLAAAAAETSLSGDLAELDQAIKELRQWQRVGRLRVGATGQLLLQGVLAAVHPLEDDEAYQRANPIQADGLVSLDGAANEAREDAQVRRALAHEQCAVVVLGGAHDLSDNIRRIAPDTCEYIRVATRMQQEYSLTDSEQ